MKFTDAYWKRTYNLQDGDLASAAATIDSPEFAEAPLRPLLDQIALDQAIDSLPAEALQQQAEQAVAPFIEALQRARDDSEALGLLAEAFPQMDAETLQQQLTNLLFIADTWGRLSASADRED